MLPHPHPLAGSRRVLRFAAFFVLFFFFTATRTRLEAAQTACKAIEDFEAPAGAGEELTGPGGDGFLSVVTPGSHFGRALMGKRVGDVIEVTVAGELTEWSIVLAA
jgi:hypothetical protein